MHRGVGKFKRWMRQMLAAWLVWAQADKPCSTSHPAQWNVFHQMVDGASKQVGTIIEKEDQGTLLLDMHGVRAFVAAEMKGAPGRAMQL